MLILGADSNNLDISCLICHIFSSYSDGATGARPKTRVGGGRLHEDRIKVCVRKRPLSKREAKSGEEDMVQAASTTTLVVSEPKQAVDLTAYTRQVKYYSCSHIMWPRYLCW